MTIRKNDGGVALRSPTPLATRLGGALRQATDGDDESSLCALIGAEPTDTGDAMAVLATLHALDMAPLDPRPDPKDTRGIPLLVYDPGTKGLSTEPLEEFLDLLPTRIVQFRIYALDHHHDAALSKAAATVLNKTPSSFESQL